MKIVFLAMVIFGEATLLSLQAASRPAAATSDIEKDWMRQDSGRVDVSACFADAKANTLESGMAEAVVADLAVPYCGSYLEGCAWDAEDEEAYARFQRKRVVYAQQELADLRKALNP